MRGSVLSTERNNRFSCGKSHSCGCENGGFVNDLVNVNIPSLSGYFTWTPSLGTRKNLN